MEQQKFREIRLSKKITPNILYNFHNFFLFFFRQAEKERRTRYKKQEEDREVERQTIRDKVLLSFYFFCHQIF